MKKYILTTVFAVICLVASAQVGVGTANPETSLHVVGASATGTANIPGGLTSADGITVPIVTTDMTSTSTPGTKISQMVYSTNTASTGYYFWSGTNWVVMSGAPEIEIHYGTDVVTIDVQVTADLDISASSNNVFNLTNGEASSSYHITMPDPATNVGRVIIFNTLNSVNSGNAFFTFSDQIGLAINDKLKIERVIKVFCNGIGWGLIANQF